MSHIPSNCLQNLVCSTCHKYLSRFPVYSDPNGITTCGRCPEPMDSYRNSTYENAVEYQKFPCCYDSNGCLENMFPMDLVKHEKVCPFRKFPCPYLVPPGSGNGTECKWNGFPKDLLAHFETKHPTFILGEGKFEVDFINNHKEKYLLPYGEEVYLVDRSNDSKSNTFYCNVSYIGSNPECEKYDYKVIFQDSNKQKQHEMLKPLDRGIDVNGEVIRGLLNDPVSIVARIEIISKGEDNMVVPEKPTVDGGIDRQLLKELECLICYEYMLPPIYQCLTGHSVCSTCKDQSKECPYCKQPFQNTINFALAQIINHINYPCKFERCTFYSKAKDIRQHEENCIYGPFKCPVKDYLGCDQVLIFDEVYQHILNNHYENLLELESVKIPFNADDNLEDCFIIRSCEKLFKLHFRYHDGELGWAVQLIGPVAESANYRYEIDILDNTGSNCRVYFKKTCTALVDKDVAFDDQRQCIAMDYSSLSELINTELIFRVRVTKV